MQRILTITIVTVTIIGIVGCQSVPKTNSNSSSNVAAKSEQSPRPSQSPTASPLEVLKAWQEAINKGDIEAYKRTLSKDFLKSIDDGAKKDNVTVDEFIKGSGDMGYFRNLFPMPFKILKEIPEGDQMTYHIKDSRGRLHWATLMKEDGEWKVDQDATIGLVDE